MVVRAPILNSFRRQHMEAGPTTITANVGIGSTGQGGFGLDVELHIFMPGVDKATAEKLVELAHKVCPYSNATRGNIPVKLVVEEQPLVEENA
jgi:osmotically inducible protein OsmC